MNARAVTAIELFLVFFFGIRKNRRRLPDEQCIVIANHNSSLDTYVLASLFSWRHKNRTRVAAAKDTFAGGFAGWAARRSLQVILVDRAPVGAHDPLAEVKQLLREGNSLILYPEGTRGEPGKLEEFKRGIGVLAAEFPDLPVYPVFIKGVEKCLARDEYLLVPFEIQIKVAENPIRGREFLKEGVTKRNASKQIAHFLEERVRGLGAV